MSGHLSSVWLTPWLELYMTLYKNTGSEWMINRIHCQNMKSEQIPTQCAKDIRQGWSDSLVDGVLHGLWIGQRLCLLQHHHWLWILSSNKRKSSTDSPWKTLIQKSKKTIFSEPLMLIQDIKDVTRPASTSAYYKIRAMRNSFDVPMTPNRGLEIHSWA